MNKKKKQPSKSSQTLRQKIYQTLAVPFDRMGHYYDKYHFWWLPFLAIILSLFYLTYQDNLVKLDKLQKTSPEIQTISNVALMEKIQEEEADHFLVIDLRESSQFHRGHIKNAISVPYNSPLETYLRIPDKKIILVSEREEPAQIISLALQKLGYLDVLVLEDGLESWTKEGFPLKIN